MNLEPIHVGIAEIKVANTHSEMICLGLGSCVAVVLYDPRNQIGGVAHVMLPNSREVANITSPGKFADTAVTDLLRQMKEKGAEIKKAQAKIFGGANMFSSITSSNKQTIGEMNIHAVMKELDYYDIPLIAKDVGGHTGRSIYFFTINGLVTMRQMKEGIKRDY